MRFFSLAHIADRFVAPPKTRFPNLLDQLKRKRVDTLSPGEAAAGQGNEEDLAPSTATTMPSVLDHRNDETTYERGALPKRSPVRTSPI